MPQGKQFIYLWPKPKTRDYRNYACKTLGCIAWALTLVSATTIAAVTAAIIYLLTR